MKTTKILMVLTFLLVAGYVYSQGSLTPPGAPAPTMKTLAQVEPRTPISSVGYVISQSGSYYLTTNLTAGAGQIGITVAANDVTIDLNGFTLDGAGIGTDGINQGAAYHRLTIRNGMVKGWSGKSRCGIHLLGEDAVLEDLQLSGNLTAVSSAGYATLRCCEAVGNNGDGFNLNQGMVLNCRAADNLGDGIEMASNGVVRASVCANNGKININVSGSGCTIEDNKLTGGVTGIALQSGGNRIANNEVYGAKDNYDLAQGNQLDLLLCEIPESIDWSASVKLAGSLESTGHGVVITASGVTLDLMGFTLSGDRGSSDYGLFLDGETNSAIRNVVVRNGIVRNFGNGVRAEYAQDSRFERLIIASNRTYGVSLSASSGQCDGNTIADCTISGNGNSGIRLDGSSGQCNGNTIADCTISGNKYGVYLYGSSGQCKGNTFADCTISGNADYGVSLYSYYGLCDGNTLANCTISGNAGGGVSLYGNSGQCDDNTLTDCTISENADYGVYLHSNSGGSPCNGNTLAGCTISGNGSYGIHLYSSSSWCNGNTIADCTIRGNGSYGVYLYGHVGQCDGNTLTDCTISENADYGVYLYSYYGLCDGNTLANCTIRRNANYGVYFDGSDGQCDGNRVEGNHITGQTGTTTYGIRCDNTAGNLIVRNTCVGQTHNFTMDPDDTYGPIITSSGPLSTTGAEAHPWANFSR